MGEEQKQRPSLVGAALEESQSPEGSDFDCNSTLLIRLGSLMNIGSIR